MTVRARLGQPAIADHEEIRPVGRATLAGNLKGRRRARLCGLGLSSLRVSPRPGTGRCQCGLRLAGWAGGFSGKHIWRCAARQRGSLAWSESSWPPKKATQSSKAGRAESSVAAPISFRQQSHRALRKQPFRPSSSWQQSRLHFVTIFACCPSPVHQPTELCSYHLCCPLPQAARLQRTEAHQQPADPSLSSSRAFESSRMAQGKDLPALRPTACRTRTHSAR